MVIQLGQGRYDLETYIESNVPLEELLVEGRFLQSDFHDAECPKNDHMHWYRKVLKTYDPEKDTVLLSKKGSRRLIDNLDDPEREFSRQELYEESIRMNWKVRPEDHKLY